MRLWRAAPDKVKALDYRIWQEYAFVGRAPMAFNVLYKLFTKLFTGKWDAASKPYGLADNPDFEAGVKKLLQPNDAILVICRSGQRSADSILRATS